MTNRRGFLALFALAATMTPAKSQILTPQNFPLGPEGPSSDFAFDELIKPAEAPTRNPQALAITVAEQLAERRIYVYAEVKGPSSTDQWFLGAEVVALNHGTAVGRFPCSFGNIITSSTNQSLLSIFNAGGSPVGDSLVARLANPFDTTSTGIQVAVVQPLRVNMHFNRLIFNLLAASGSTVVGWRALMACLSTRY